MNLMWWLLMLIGATHSLRWLAPLRFPGRNNTLKGRYLLKLRSTRGFKASPLKLLRLFQKMRVKFRPRKFRAFPNLFSLSLTPYLVAKVRQLREVEYIEADYLIGVETIQNKSPWHLARISQRNLLKNNTEQYQFSYDFTGRGVTVYVVDSGINVNLPEFEGRARHGATFLGDSNRDENGHGTFVAGLIGSKTYGVAKEVDLVSLKIFNAEGFSTGSSTIAAIDWAVGDVIKNGRNRRGNIINLSLGTAKSQALNEAVENAYEQNILVVTAAGNQNIDACTRSPASEPNTLTVGSIDLNDTRSSFSSYGSCVDIFAPGEDLTSTSNLGGIDTLSGTSAATPIVAGIAACFQSRYKLNAKTTKDYILSVSTKSALHKINPNSPNRLAYLSPIILKQENTTKEPVENENNTKESTEIESTTKESTEDENITKEPIENENTTQEPKEPENATQNLKESENIKEPTQKNLIET